MKRSLLKAAGFGAVATLSAVTLAITPGENVRQTNLVNRGTDPPARFTDPNLVNACGIVALDGLIWVADNGTGKATVYDANGFPFPVWHPIVINVNGKDGDGNFLRNGDPTGIVRNSREGFHVHKNGVTRSSAFLFAEENGTVAGWSPEVDLDDARVVIDDHGEAIYKGLTIASDGDEPRLFVANFGEVDAGEIRVFDRMFQPVTTFTDDDPPPLPPDAPPGGVFTPFNVVAVNDILVVTFAVKVPGAWDAAECTGCGFVDLFSPDGARLAQIHGNIFDAPWGVSLAPLSFGQFSNDLLVGNLGNGKINAIDLQTQKFAGRLLNADGHDLVIDGLWGIARSKAFGTLDTAFFAAGPNQDSAGLMGKLEPIP